MALFQHGVFAFLHAISGLRWRSVSSIYERTQLNKWRCVFFLLQTLLQSSHYTYFSSWDKIKMCVFYFDRHTQISHMSTSTFLCFLLVYLVMIFGADQSLLRCFPAALPTEPSANKPCGRPRHLFICISQRYFLHLVECGSFHRSC